jgi:hypothetical protein
VRGAHPLSSAERGAVQDSKRKPASEGHLPPVDHSARDWSGKRNKVSPEDALTYCQAQSEGLVWTTKESQQAMGTYSLESTEGEGETSQNMEEKQANEGDSRTGECKGRDRSRDRKKENDWAMSTHHLDSTKGGTCQDVERKRASNVYSHTRRHRGRQVRARKEGKGARATHKLESVEGGRS